jgi:hypothetical protein
MEPRASKTGSANRVLAAGDRVERREFIKRLTATAVAASPLITDVFGAPLAQRSPSVGNPAEKAIGALYQALTAEQRREICFDWDYRVNIRYGRKPLTMPDPGGILLRTHVSNAWLITPHTIGSPFYSDEQRALILDVLRTILSPAWVEKIIQQAKDDTGKPWGADQAVAIFGVPGSERCQCVITGFHMTLRASSETEPLAAFGGPITHGHQPSGFYEKVGHPGNIFWQQALRANDVYKLLDGKQQSQALLAHNLPFFQYLGEVDRTNIMPDTPRDEPRRESDIRFRRPGTASPGLPVAAMGKEQRQALKKVLESLIEPYCQTNRDQVFDCLKKQGGLQKCSLAFYQERDLGDDGQWDNWRLEGPSLVWFFRGSPHVHIWIHVASDPSSPISSYFG